jgi:hypothetical protein
MKHMTLEEWDRRVAPFLATIGIRAKHIENDARQITEWVRLLPVAPAFPTEAIGKLQDATTELELALNEIHMALEAYHEKEKVK